MGGKVIPEVLHQRWLHSHEEDTDREMIFRPATFNFPRSRGRTGFELKRDGSLVEIGIAPTDGPLEAQGRWKLEGDDQLTFYAGGQSEPKRVMRITSADKGRLVVIK